MNWIHRFDSVFVSAILHLMIVIRCRLERSGHDSPSNRSAIQDLNQSLANTAILSIEPVASVPKYLSHASSSVAINSLVGRVNSLW